MVLLTPENGWLSSAWHSYEEWAYRGLEVPTGKNFLRVMDILTKKDTALETTDHEGNIISIEPTVFHHTMGEYSWNERGITVRVRQRLPSGMVDGDKYLSTIIRRAGKGTADVSTCVVVPTEGDEVYEYGDFKRIGDLRIDYIREDGSFSEGIVDGNDNAFGLPTGEWHIDGVPHHNALFRAYSLVVNYAFGVGEVPPLGYQYGGSGMLESGN